MKKIITASDYLLKAGWIQDGSFWIRGNQHLFESEAFLITYTPAKTKRTFVIQEGIFGTKDLQPIRRSNRRRPPEGSQISCLDLLYKSEPQDQGSKAASNQCGKGKDPIRKDRAHKGVGHRGIQKVSDRRSGTKRKETRRIKKGAR